MQEKRQAPNCIFQTCDNLIFLFQILLFFKLIILFFCLPHLSCIMQNINKSRQLMTVILTKQLPHYTWSLEGRKWHLFILQTRYLNRKLHTTKLSHGCDEGWWYIIIMKCDGFHYFQQDGYTVMITIKR